MFDSRTKIDPVDKKHKQCIKKIPFNDGQGKREDKKKGIFGSQNCTIEWNNAGLVEPRNKMEKYLRLSFKTSDSEKGTWKTDGKKN